MWADDLKTELDNGNKNRIDDKKDILISAKKAGLEPRQYNYYYEILPSNFKRTYSDNDELLTNPNLDREEKLDTNSPQTVEDWIRLNDALDSFIQMFDPLVNDRYQRHWLLLGKIVKDYIEHGGSAASSMNKVDTYILNKKTGKPEKRGITKEHIDNKVLEWIDAFVQMQVTYILIFAVFN